MSERLECFVGCKKCDVKVGKVMARNLPERDYIWQNYTEPDPLPVFCKLCAGVIERI